MAERRHPDWIKVRAPLSAEYFRTRSILQELKLHSVCQEACCPNIGECFSHRTATFMLMGDVCTRNCPYCAVAHGKVRPLDAGEPQRIAEAVARLGLQHVVVTSVDRDDLPDGGAAHFAATARAIKELRPAARVEVLVPDFRGSHKSVETVVDAPVDIYNHNTETVPSLYSQCRPGGRYETVLDVLESCQKVRSSVGTRAADQNRHYAWARRGTRRIDDRAGRLARSRLRYSDPRPILAAVTGSSTGGALSAAGGVHRSEG